MKKYYSFFLLACIVISLKAQENLQSREIEYPFAAPKSEVNRGIFGSKDDRKEVKDAEGYEDFVRATAVMIRRPEKVAKKSGYMSLAKYLKKARKGRL